ncbi:MAG: PEP-CTERM sorting domain-containing protein [Planctomycetes bacterium]|nr:PEP-CTERM sorting domain-containing protein [Planctomycetota bacterium]
MKTFVLLSVMALLGLLISVATAAPTDAPATTSLDATGPAPAMATIMPEPCTAGLLSLGAVAIGVRRVRRKVV